MWGKIVSESLAFVWVNLSVGLQMASEKERKAPIRGSYKFICCNDLEAVAGRHCTLAGPPSQSTHYSTHAHYMNRTHTFLLYSAIKLHAFGAVLRGFFRGLCCGGSSRGSFALLAGPLPSGRYILGGTGTGLIDLDRFFVAGL